MSVPRNDLLPPTEEPEAVDPVQLRRATLASSVGSALEYYDFYIYGLASALIFGELFFKPLGPAAAPSRPSAPTPSGSRPARSAA